eukprot:Pgem_evm1s12155
MTARTRIVSGFVFLLTLCFAFITLVALVTTQWFSNKDSGVHYGIPSNCDDEASVS